MNFFRKIKKCRKIADSLLTNVLFRTDSSRSGFENDNTSNIALRFYLKKNDILDDSKMLFDENEDLTKKASQVIKEQAVFLNNAANTFFNRINEDVSIPKRYQIFINRNDDFYSIVLGYKLSRNNAVAVNDLRHHLGVCCNEIDSPVLYVNVNNYKSHEPLCVYDILHVNEGPFRDFSRNACNNYFTIKPIENEGGMS
ncbi:MAG: hypothetical protein JO131_03240 [Gammaproteobacteria bacterium]|nr:hypothetical protein [Gammaproteobacteria bacterium]